MTHRDLAPLALALVLDARLQATLDDPFHMRAARLYGFTVHDPAALASLVNGPSDVIAATDGAVRATCLGEGDDPYWLLAGPLGLFACSFDAAGLVTLGWAAPLLDERDEYGRLTTGVRPSLHPERVRIRISATVCDQGVATVLRRSDDPDAAVAIGERGEGELVDTLERLWFGDPLELALSRVTARADRSRRARHRRSP